MKYTKGQILVANSETKYTITSTRRKCVVEVLSEITDSSLNDIRVKVLENTLKEYIGYVYSVNSMYFDLKEPLKIELNYEIY